MNKKIFIGIGIFWVIIILAFVSVKEFTLKTGDEILLKTRPVDPRDLFRGDYVILSYDVSILDLNELAPDNSKFNTSDKIFVSIEMEEGFGIAKRIFEEKPSKGLFIKGTVKRASGSTLTVDYGIESYFVPEGKGRELERERGKNLAVKVAVDKFGNAIIKDLVIVENGAQTVPVASLGSISDDIESKFDDLFVSFQKMHTKFESLFFSYMDTPATVKSSRNHIEAIGEELQNARDSIQFMNASADKLEGMDLSEESLQKVGALRLVLGEYSLALDQMEAANEGYKLFVDFRDFESQIFQGIDKYQTYSDLSDELVGDKKYSEALKELERAIVLNDEMFEIRENQLAQNDRLKMSLIGTAWEEDVKFKEYIDKRKEELTELSKNPNVADSSRFIESDKLYSEYNDIAITDGDYDDFVESWLYDHVYQFLDKADEILIEADSNHDSLMRSFYLRQNIN